MDLPPNKSRQFNSDAPLPEGGNCEKTMEARGPGMCGLQPSLHKPARLATLMWL
jgi:hypothetical protein